ncbi:MAG: hypothetical protein KAI73_10155 [Rhodospirillaceae bacterium]|nr:hypothetical protein [Rhodospirillaceae bacterium]
MKRNNIILTAAVVGLSALVATTALASGYGQGMGHGQGQGQGQGYMQNHEDGQGRMQAHMQGQGMGKGMGQGHEQGMGHGKGQGAENHDFLTSLDKPITVETARAALEAHLEDEGKEGFKVGKVESKDSETIIAEIVNEDGNVFRSIEIDKATGNPSRVR